MIKIKNIFRNSVIYIPLLNSYIFLRALKNFFLIKLGKDDQNDMIDFFINLAEKGDLKDEQIDGYVEKFGECKNSIENLKQIIKDDISKEYMPDAIVMEYGCGTGRYLKMFEDQFNIIGIDSSLSVLDKITRKKIQTGKFFNFTFTDKEKLKNFTDEYNGKINVIFSIEVFQILQRSKINILLKSFNNLLIENGILILVFPLPNRWQDKYARIGFYRYSVREMESLLKANNMYVEKSFLYKYDDNAESHYILARKLK